MSVYQVEQYYIHMSIEGVDEGKLKDYLSENGLSDYDIDAGNEVIVIDGMECDNMAAQHEEEINQLRVTK